MSEEAIVNSYRRLWLYVIPGAFAILGGMLKARGVLFGVDSERNLGYAIAGAGVLLILYGVLFAVVRCKFGMQIEISRLLWKRTIHWNDVQSVSSERRIGEMNAALARRAIHRPIFLLAAVPEQMLEIRLKNGRSLKAKVSLADLPKIQRIAAAHSKVDSRMNGWTDLEAAKELIQDDPHAAKRALTRLIHRFPDSDIANEASLLLRNIR